LIADCPNVLMFQCFSMISTAKNTFYLLVAYAYQKVVALFYFILLARYLGADNFGKYTFAISFTALFAVLIDVGMFTVLTREIARDRKKTKSYSGNILTFNIISSVLVFFIIYLVINLLNYPLLTKQLVYLNILVIFLDALALCLYHVFRGYLNLKFESLGIVVHKTVMLIVGLILIYLRAPIVFMVLPLVAGSIFYLINAVIFFKKKMHAWPWPRFNIKVMKSLLVLAWPFFVTAIFAKIFATSDTILLSFQAGDKFVGWYSAAQKLVLAFLLLIAGSLSTALYPSFSYYFIHSKEYLKKLFTQGIFYMILITIPLALGLIVLARPIVLFIYGSDYLSAVPALIILATALPFMFLDYVISGFLNACEKQKINTLIHGLGAGIFVALNLFLVPLFFHVGSSLAVLVSFLFLFVLEIYWSQKIIEINWRYLLRKFILICLVGLLMSAVLLVIKDRLHLILTVVIGTAVYFIFAYILGLIKKQELLFLTTIIKNKKK